MGKKMKESSAARRAKAVAAMALVTATLAGTGYMGINAYAGNGVSGEGPGNTGVSRPVVNTNTITDTVKYTVTIHDTLIVERNLGSQEFSASKTMSKDMPEADKKKADEELKTSLQDKIKKAFPEAEYTFKWGDLVETAAQDGGRVFTGSVGVRRKDAQAAPGKALVFLKTTVNLLDKNGKVANTETLYHEKSIETSPYETNRSANLQERWETEDYNLLERKYPNYTIGNPTGEVAPESNKLEQSLLITYNLTPKPVATVTDTMQMKVTLSDGTTGNYSRSYTFPASNKTPSDADHETAKNDMVEKIKADILKDYPESGYSVTFGEVTQSATSGSSRSYTSSATVTKKANEGNHGNEGGSHEGNVGNEGGSHEGSTPSAKKTINMTEDIHWVFMAVNLTPVDEGTFTYKGSAETTPEEADKTVAAQHDAWVKEALRELQSSGNSRWKWGYSPAVKPKTTMGADGSYHTSTEITLTPNPPRDEEHPDHSGNTGEGEGGTHEGETPNTKTINMIQKDHWVLKGTDGKTSKDGTYTYNGSIVATPEEANKTATTQHEAWLKESLSKLHETYPESDYVYATNDKGINGTDTLNMGAEITITPKAKSDEGGTHEGGDNDHGDHGGSTTPADKPRTITVKGRATWKLLGEDNNTVVQEGTITKSKDITTTDANKDNDIANLRQQWKDEVKAELEKKFPDQHIALVSDSGIPENGVYNMVWLVYPRPKKTIEVENSYKVVKDGKETDKGSFHHSQDYTGIPSDEKKVRDELTEKWLKEDEAALKAKYPEATVTRNADPAEGIFTVTLKPEPKPEPKPDKQDGKADSNKSDDSVDKAKLAQTGASVTGAGIVASILTVLGIFLKNRRKKVD